MTARPLSQAPARDRANCVQCGDVLDVRANGVGEIVYAVQVVGLHVGRGITLVERQRRWLCRTCVDHRKRGHKWSQLDLFGDGGS